MLGIFKRIGFILTLTFIPTSAFCIEKLIFDHDGAVDDLSALIVLLGAKDKYELKAVTLQPADSFKASATTTTQKVLDFLGVEGVTIAASDLVGLNPFPNEWRADSDKMDARMNEFLGSLRPHSKNLIDPRPAPVVLADLLSHDRYTLVLTGPLSNLAAALRLNPAIRQNINHLYIMGGAVRTRGNVDEFPEAGEWNFYNSPEDARYVIRSGIQITLVPLDATNHVRVKDPLVEGSLPVLDLFFNQQAPASLLCHALWDIVKVPVTDGIHFFWDTLTAAVAIDPTIVATERLNIRVRTEKPFEGRTEISQEEGTPVSVAIGVNKKQFQTVLLKNLNYGSRKISVGGE